MKSITFLVIFSLFFIIAKAQNDSASVKNKVIVNKEAGIDKVINTYFEAYTFMGYRIQIGSENKSQYAKKIRATFIQQYKDVAAYEVYQQPYYKVRVGDFKTKLEAVKFQKEISTQFPNSFIVKDNIEFLNEH